MSGCSTPGTRSLSILTRLRNSKLPGSAVPCDLLAITPENQQPDRPYAIATRDREYQLQEIIADLKKLKKGKQDLVYEITDTEVHRMKKE